jgi:hypothetical protein
MRPGTTRVIAPLLAALCWIGALASPATAQVRAAPVLPAPAPMLTPSIRAYCELVIDDLAGRYATNSRSVWLDVTIRNAGTADCPPSKVTTLLFSWKVHTYYLLGGNELPPLAFSGSVSKYPADGAKLGTIKAGGTKVISITPSYGYATSPEYKFVKADICVSNIVVRYERAGKSTASPGVNDCFLVMAPS